MLKPITEGRKSSKTPQYLAEPKRELATNLFFTAAISSDDSDEEPKGYLQEFLDRKKKMGIHLTSKLPDLSKQYPSFQSKNAPEVQLRLCRYGTKYTDIQKLINLKMTVGSKKNLNVIPRFQAAQKLPYMTDDGKVGLSDYQM